MQDVWILFPASATSAVDDDQWAVAHLRAILWNGYHGASYELSGHRRLFVHSQYAEGTCWNCARVPQSIPANAKRYVVLACWCTLNRNFAIWLPSIDLCGTLEAIIFKRSPANRLWFMNCDAHTVFVLFRRVPLIRANKLFASKQVKHKPFLATFDIHAQSSFVVCRAQVAFQVHRQKLERCCRDLGIHFNGSRSPNLVNVIFDYTVQMKPTHFHVIDLIIRCTAISSWYGC